MSVSWNLRLFVANLILERVIWCNPWRQDPNTEDSGDALLGGAILEHRILRCMADQQLMECLDPWAGDGVQ